MRQICPTGRDGNPLVSAAIGAAPVTHSAVTSPCSGPMANAMTVDVEDYFQVSAFSNRIAREDWDNYPCRIERNVDAILELFDDDAIHATFFILGWIGERYPQMLRSIVSAGHELASHGLFHVRVHDRARKNSAPIFAGLNACSKTWRASPLMATGRRVFPLGRGPPGLSRSWPKRGIPTALASIPSGMIFTVCLRPRELFFTLKEALIFLRFQSRPYGFCITTFPAAVVAIFG